MISTIGRSTGAASLKESRMNDSRGASCPCAAATAAAEPKYGAERGLARVPPMTLLALAAGNCTREMRLNMGGPRWLIRNMSG
jgi:hypothetical protein